MLNCPECKSKYISVMATESAKTYCQCRQCNHAFIIGDEAEIERKRKDSEMSISKETLQRFFIETMQEKVALTIKVDELKAEVADLDRALFRCSESREDMVEEFSLQENLLTIATELLRDLDDYLDTHGDIEKGSKACSDIKEALAKIKGDNR
jgi:hypothetical protein